MTEHKSRVSNLVAAFQQQLTSSSSNSALSSSVKPLSNCSFDPKPSQIVNNVSNIVHDQINATTSVPVDVTARKGSSISFHPNGVTVRPSVNISDISSSLLSELPSSNVNTGSSSSSLSSTSAQSSYNHHNSQIPSSHSVSALVNSSPDPLISSFSSSRLHSHSCSPFTSSTSSTSTANARPFSKSLVASPNTSTLLSGTVRSSSLIPSLAAVNNAPTGVSPVSVPARSPSNSSSHSALPLSPASPSIRSPPPIPPEYLRRSVSHSQSLSSLLSPSPSSSIITRSRAPSSPPPVPEKPSSPSSVDDLHISQSSPITSPLSAVHETTDFTPVSNDASRSSSAPPEAPTVVQSADSSTVKHTNGRVASMANVFSPPSFTSSRQRSATEFVSPPRAAVSDSSNDRSDRSSTSTNQFPVLTRERSVGISKALESLFSSSPSPISNRYSTVNLSRNSSKYHEDEYEADPKPDTPPTNSAQSSRRNEQLSKQNQEELERERLEESKLTDSERSHRNELREKVISEIKSTEKSYLVCLELLVKHFVHPLQLAQNEKQLTLSQLTLSAIINNIETLTTFHRIFYNELNHQQNQSIPKVFLKYSDYLKMYTAYLNGYEKCLKEMNSLRTDKKFGEFMIQVKQSLDQDPQSTGIDLMSLLITPVQRIPRYTLLLGELKKHTAPSYSDYFDLLEAFGKIREIAEHVNISMKAAENMTKVAEIQQKILGNFSDLIAPHRRLIVQGTMKIMKSSNKLFGTKQNKFDEYICYLFNDLFLFVTSSYRYKGSMELYSTKMEKKSIQTNNELFSGFQLSNANNDLFIICKDDQEINEWVNEITRLIDILQKQREKQRRRHRFQSLKKHSVRQPYFHQFITQKLNDVVQQKDQIQNNQNINSNNNTEITNDTSHVNSRTRQMSNATFAMPQTIIEQLKRRNTETSTTTSSAETYETSVISTRNSEFDELSPEAN